MAIASGTTNQSKLYKHLGFVPFGPIVGTENAYYQPMYVTLKDFQSHVPKLFSENHKEITKLPRTKKFINIMPGPVNIPHDVQTVFQSIPVSHRSDRFMADILAIKHDLCSLTQAQSVELFSGNGSLANEMIAAQLKQMNQIGLILSNGEFGERLISQAHRAGLDFTTIKANWGQPFNFIQIKQHLQQHPTTKWLWVVHCETSTGILNNIEQLSQICRTANIYLCVDCISSLGTVPINLQHILFASAVSGKGLASFAGLGLVFYNHQLKPNQKIPKCLDLGYYAAKQGVPFTLLSNLVYALRAALICRNYPEHYAILSNLSRRLRQAMTAYKLPILVSATLASPAVFTLPLPSCVNSVHIGNQLQANGYLLNYKSQYLVERNWIQICLMGECVYKEIMPLLNFLSKTINSR